MRCGFSGRHYIIPFEFAFGYLGYLTSPIPLSLSGRIGHRCREAGLCAFHEKIAPELSGL